MLAIVTSVIAGLTVAGVIALAKSRWLYLVVPKLYFETPLSKGAVISMTLVNGGLRTEDGIKVTLRKMCSYELLASSRSGTVLAGNALTVPRLGRSESITVLLLVEGKAFEHSDIESVESKETTGKVVEDKANANGPVMHLIMWPIIVLLFGAPFAFGTYVGKSEGSWVWDWISGSTDALVPTKQLAGYRSEIGNIFGTHNWAKSIESGELTHRIKEVVRRRDVLEIQLQLVNKTSHIVSATVNAKTPAQGAGQLKFEERSISDRFVGPGQLVDATIRVYLPEATKPQMVVLEVHFDAMGDRAWYSQTLSFD